MTAYPKMSKRFAKRLKGSRLKSKVKMFLITTAVVFIIISFFWGEFGFFRMWFLAGQVDDLKREIVTLKVQRQDVLWEIDKMKRDPDYIRRFAVEKYGYARADQKIIQFVPSDSSAPSQIRQTLGR